MSSQQPETQIGVARRRVELTPPSARRIAVDLTGRQVLPSATHAVSGLGTTQAGPAAALPGSDLGDGLDV